MSGKQKRAAYQVLDMSCVSCARLVEGFLEKQAGILSVKVNEMLNIFYIDYEPDKISEEELERIIKKTGYKTVRVRSLREVH